MQTLDWGQITPESVNLTTRVCTHVYNHDLTTLDKVDRSIRFILGRILYFDLHLPPNIAHSVKIDIRGQNINEEFEELVKYELRNKYPNPLFLTIDFVKQ